MNILRFPPGGRFSESITGRPCYPPGEVIHHSDQAVQYAAQGPIDVLEAYQFGINMPRKGNP